MKFSITITLKKDVLDPQGKVVQNTLQNLNFKNLKNIRQGKYFEIEVNNDNQKDVEKKIDEKFDQLSSKKIGRNEPCPCNSGKKYKHCHGSL